MRNSNNLPESLRDPNYYSNYSIGPDLILSFMETRDCLEPIINLMGEDGNSNTELLLFMVNNSTTSNTNRVQLFKALMDNGMLDNVIFSRAYGPKNPASIKIPLPKTWIGELTSNEGLGLEEFNDIVREGLIMKHEPRESMIVQTIYKLGLENYIAENWADFVEPRLLIDFLNDIYYEAENYLPDTAKAWYKNNIIDKIGDGSTLTILDEDISKMHAYHSHFPNKYKANGTLDQIDKSNSSQEIIEQFIKSWQITQ